MKTKVYLFVAPIFLATNLFSQTKVLKPSTAKTVGPTPAANIKPQNTPESATNLEKAGVKVIDRGPAGFIQNATVNIVVADDGKDAATKVGMILYDENNRVAAYYGDNQGLNGTSGDEYSPGQNVTLVTTLFAGELQTQPNNPSTVTSRNSFFSEFTFNGGSLNVSLHTGAGVDIWKIKSLSLSLSFENDIHSHTITWNNVEVTSSEFSKQLKFDKHFNAIQ